MSEPAAASPAIEIAALGLVAAGKTLLEDASLKVPRGEVALLVGLSGSGKSLTMRLLLGLLDPEDPAVSVRGEARLFGEPARSSAARRAGIVFQDFGLFDEWTARENVLFGFDHRAGHRASDRGAAADRLLAEFALAGTARPALMSGGQRQRTALARTLAYDPDILFYDEPTSGLDPAMAAQVAARIRTTNDEHEKTSFVITHDLSSLVPIADRIILLDARARTFREVGKEAIDAELARLAGAPFEDRSGGDSTPLGRSVFGTVAATATDFLRTTARAVEAAVLAGFALLPRWPRIGWGFRYLWYYLRLTAVGSAMAYVSLAGFVLGLIVTYFTYNYLPFRKYTEPIVLDSITGAIGYSIFRIMAPGMTAMLMAARSGAAIAADVGHRVYSRQTDALRSFGVRPERYFLTNILWAHLIGTPLLLFLNFAWASFGSLVVFVFVHPEHSTFFFTSEYTRLLDRGPGVWEGTAGVVWKSLLAALGTGAIAYFQASRPKRSGRDVSQAVTATIIWSTIFALMVQLVAAIIEFKPT